VPFPIRGVGQALGLYDGADIGSRFLFVFVFFLLEVNIFWPLLNLVPVPPLDGGQIVREGLLALGVADAARISAMIGVVAAGLVAWWGFARGEQYLGIMFAMLAVSCFQSLSEDTPWRRWN
jgi:Zn-dependent protease